MNCRDAIRSMYLYREGELPETTRLEVERHARSCERCARELRLLGKGSSMVADLRETEPRLHNGPDLADHIIRAIRTGERGKARTFTLEGGVSLRRLQFTCTLAAAVIAGLFFLQSTIDVYRMALLERRLSGPLPAALAGPAEARLAARAIHMLAQTGTALSEPQHEKSLGLREQLQMRDGAQTFSDVLQQNPPGFSSVVERLREKYPDLWLISLADGLNERERDVLARRGKALVQDIHELLHPGEHQYED